MALNKDFLHILACPKCKCDVHLSEELGGMVCENCRLLYEIREDIPIMIIDEAKKL